MLNMQNLLISVLAGGRTGGILISDNFTASTDGSILAVVNRPRSGAEDFPCSPDSTPSQPKQGKFIISNEDAQKLLKGIPKKSKAPILKNIMPLTPLPDNTRRFLFGELGSMQVMTVNPIWEKFPCLTKKVWPKSKPKIKVSFSVNLLERLLSTIKKASITSFPAVSFTLYGPEEAAKFECELTLEGQKMTGLIMPCEKRNTR